MFAIITIPLVISLAANGLGYNGHVHQTHQSYGYDHHGPKYDHPGPEYDYPGSEYDYPGPGYDYPGPGYDYPGPDYEYFGPSKSCELPGTSTSRPLEYYSYPKPTSTPVAALLQSSAGSDVASSFGQSVSEQMCRNQYFPMQIPGYSAIYGGIKSGPNEFLFMAAVGWQTSNGVYDYPCGGILIAAFFVLTAGHCRSLRGKPPDVVRVGGGSLDSTVPDHQPIEVTNVYVHNQYMRRQIYNDIALLKIKKAPQYYPACLWPTNAINYRTATVTGYGRTENDPIGSNDLIKADVNLISNELCSPYYPPGFRYRNGLISSQLCAGDFSRAIDTCPGDSGGPILVKKLIQGTEVPYILGVTSFGAECGRNVPAIYTRVSSFIDWIESTIMQNK